MHGRLLAAQRSAGAGNTGAAGVEGEAIRASTEIARNPAATPADPRMHAFDDVRLLAAVAVLVSHCPQMYGSGVYLKLGGFFVGSLAVLVFFAVSGYLIAQSWHADPDVGRFMARRALRLVPALLVVVLVAIFAIGPTFTTLPLGAYFEHADTWRYVSNVAFILQPGLPGLFQNHHDPQLGINAPLWSLHYEAMMYAGLVIACVLCKPFPRLMAPLFVAAVVALSSQTMMLEQAADLACMCFTFGAAFYVYRERIAWRADLGFVALAAVLVLIPPSTAQQFAALIAVSYTAIAAGRSSWQPVRFVTRFGDLSYGTYIWAYPVQRVVNDLLGPDSHWLISLALALAGTLALAALSWRFVEKPALSFKPAKRGTP